MPSKKNTKTKDVADEEVEVTGPGWVDKMNQAIDDLSESRTRYEDLIYAHRVARETHCI